MTIRLFKNKKEKTVPISLVNELKMEINGLDKRIDRLEKKLKDNSATQTKRIASTLRNYFAQRNLNAVAVNKDTGIDIASINEIINGRRQATKNEAQRLQKAYGIQPFFVLYGTGKFVNTESRPRYKKKNT